MSKDLESFDTTTTYRTVSKDYAVAAEEFWGFISDETIAHLDLRAGLRVLDLCCGPGPMTLRLAERVGSGGCVEAVDVLEEMRTLTRERAAQRGFAHVIVREGDIDALPEGDASFDIVNCSLGLYFARDMARSLASFWSYVRPGGTLAVTTIGPRLFDPVRPVFFEACEAELPGVGTYLPWTRTDDPDVVLSLFEQAGIPGAVVSTDRRAIRLASPQAWWPIVHGSGLRQLQEELGEAAGDRVRRRCEAWIEQNGVTGINVETLRLIATKPR
ncbi:hypothetical protein GCM10009639_35320 [Kitasatospora putterlickiae]|uniref:Methyltransferase domain-containing protein n=1 Tax=Kitasatospora putterlickiae TaxID=221725 RepID=A0ABN1Y8Y2_9ACTN